MTATIDDLAQLLGFAVTPTNTEQLDRALSTARAIIAPHLIVDAFGPDAIHALDTAVLSVAQTEYRRPNSYGGTFTFGDGQDLSAVLPRDALRSVWPLLVSAGLVNPAVVA